MDTLPKKANAKKIKKFNFFKKLNYRRSEIEIGGNLISQVVGLIHHENCVSDTEALLIHAGFMIKCLRSRRVSTSFYSLLLTLIIS